MTPTDKELYACGKGILLEFYRGVMNRIHEGGNIFYDKGRFEAYKTIALLASELRNK